MRSGTFFAIFLSLTWPAVAPASPVVDAFASPMSNPAIGKMIRSTCKQENCYWFKIESLTSIQTTANGTLYKVAERTWRQSFSDQEPYPGEYSAQPKPLTDESTDDVYVYCSRQKPSIGWHLSAGESPTHKPTFMVHLLNPGAIDWVGYIGPDYAVYFAACHGLVTDTIGNQKATELAGHHLGYRALHIDYRHYQIDFDSLDQYVAWLNAPK